MKLYLKIFTPGMDGETIAYLKQDMRYQFKAQLGRVDIHSSDIDVFFDMQNGSLEEGFALLDEYIKNLSRKIGSSFLYVVGELRKTENKSEQKNTGEPGMVGEP